MLRSRKAIVIGPTPPGTGVIAEAMLDGRGEVDVADEAALVAGLLGREPVHTDVDHDRARLDEVALDQARPTDRGDQHVGARSTPRAGRACASGRSSRSRSRPAAAAPSACRTGSSARPRPPRRPPARTPASASSSITPERRARPQPGAPQREQAGVDAASGRRRPCPASIMAGQRGAVEVVGQRAAAAARRSPPGRRSGCSSSSATCSKDALRRQAPVERATIPTSTHARCLPADVHGGGRILADEHRRQARRAAVPAR